jgi:hypothetical protein
LRVSQPLWSTSFQAVPNASRSYLTEVSSGLILSVPSAASAEPSAPTSDPFAANPPG